MQNTNRKKIFLILFGLPALVLLAAAIFIGSSLFKENQIKYSNVTVGNITATGFTVSWKSDPEVPTTLWYSENDNINMLSAQTLSTKVHDIRDEEGNSARSLHIATINNLEPEKTYYFKIGSEIIPVNTDLKNTTTAKVAENIFTPNPRYLRVVNADGFGLANQTVLVSVEDTSLITYSNEDGGVAFDLNSIETGKELPEGTEIKLTVISPQTEPQEKSLIINGIEKLEDITVSEIPVSAEDQGEIIFAITQTSCNTTCNNGKDYLNRTVNGVPCNTNPAVCGGDHHYYNCSPSGTWVYTSTTCTSNPVISAPSTTTVPPTTSCRCTNGKDQFGNTVSANCNVNNAVCGANFKYYNCNASGQWIGTSTSCGNAGGGNEIDYYKCTGSGGTWSGTTCTCPSNKPYDSVTKTCKPPVVTTAPTSCICPNGKDYRGTAVTGTCGSPAKVCGGGFKNYTCSATGQWINTGETCSPPGLPTPTATPTVNPSVCQCRNGVNELGQIVTANCRALPNTPHPVCSRDHFYWDCGPNGNWVQTTTLCSSPTPTPTLEPGQAECEPHGTWLNRHCTCDSGYQLQGNTCVIRSAQCPEGYNDSGCSSQTSCPAGFLTLNSTSCTNGIKCCQPTRNTGENDCKNVQCGAGSCNPGSEQNDGQYTCTCQYGNKNPRECNPTPPTTINIVFIGNTATLNNVASVRIRYLSINADGVSAYKEPTFNAIDATHYLIELNDVYTNSGHVIVTITPKANVVCTQTSFNLGDRFDVFDRDRPGEKRVDVPLNCVATGSGGNNGGGDVVIDDPINLHGMSVEPYDPNYQDVQIGVPANYIQLIQKVAAFINSYGGKPKIPWWIIAGVLDQESSFECGNLAHQRTGSEAEVPCTGDPNQEAFTYSSTYTSVGVSQTTKNTFESLPRDTYSWRGVDTLNLTEELEACVSFLGVNRNINKESGYTTIPQDHKIDGTFDPQYSRARVGDSLCALAIQYSENAAGGDVTYRRNRQTYFAPNLWSEDTLFRAAAHYWGVPEYWICESSGLNYCNIIRRNSLNHLCSGTGRGCAAAEAARQEVAIATLQNAAVLGASDYKPEVLGIETTNSDDIIYKDKYTALLKPGTYMISAANKNVAFENKKLTVPEETKELIYEAFEDKNFNNQKDEGEEKIDLQQNLLIEKLSESYSYKLSVGWNAVSFPFNFSEFKTAKDLITYLQTKGVQITSLATFKDNTFKIVKVDDSDNFYGEDFNLDNRFGYFIKSDNTAALDLQGTTELTTRQYDLSKGWNLIGINTMASYTASSLISKCETGNVICDTLAQFNQSRYDLVVKSEGTVFGNDFDLNNKAAYFVRVQSNDNKKLEF